jgi:hypothetical protein
MRVNSGCSNHSSSSRSRLLFDLASRICFVNRFQIGGCQYLLVRPNCHCRRNRSFCHEVVPSVETIHSMKACLTLLPARYGPFRDSNGLHDNEASEYPFSQTTLSSSDTWRASLGRDLRAMYDGGKGDERAAMTGCEGVRIVCPTNMQRAGVHLDGLHKAPGRRQVYRKQQMAQLVSRCPSRWL